MGLESELMTTKEASEIWGITPRRVQILCGKGKVRKGELFVLHMRKLIAVFIQLLVVIFPSLLWF